MSTPSSMETLLSEVERPSQFNIESFMRENEDLWETQHPVLPELDEDELAERVESQLFIQDDELLDEDEVGYEDPVLYNPAISNKDSDAGLDAGTSILPNHPKEECSEISSEIPKLDGHSVDMNNKELQTATPLDATAQRAKRYFSIGHAQFNAAVSTGLSIKDVERERFKLAEQFNTFIRIWRSVVTAPTTDEFNRQRNELHKQPKKLVDYCEKTWLIPHKRRIIRCYTDRIPHFGHRVSPRTEGSHWVLKQYITTSTGDLWVTYHRICQFWANQHSTYKTHLAKVKSSTPTFTRTYLFSQLNGKVSTFALARIYKRVKEAEILKDSACPPACHDYVFMGLPCCHYIRERMDMKAPIELSTIHPHWLYNRDLGCYLQRAERGEAPFPKNIVSEPAIRGAELPPRCSKHSRGRGGVSVHRGSTHTEQVARALNYERQQQNRVLTVAPAATEQHTVYTTPTGLIIGSGSAAPPPSIAPAALGNSHKRSASVTSPRRSPGQHNRTVRKSQYNVSSQAINQAFYGILGGENDAANDLMDIPILGSRDTQEGGVGQ
ncbi:hypothetical protein ACJ73_06717 [Blastomyces percursus]|uniref:SWIM-type domain-containing protein n=1 Tax=Blastomyces percursus TaxID=1658174 RepID=A0A1J9Q016_9EURO|nr:hypothetical protein ACJ73_06717 [Blastomyces percursus]